MFDLSGRVALVTGAGRNIGRGIAETLAARGAAVAVNDLDPALAEQVVAGLVEQGADAVAVPFDVTEADSVGSGIAAAAATLGPIEVLVNNAGVPIGMNIAKFRDMDPGEWQRYIDLNVYGSLHCIRFVLDDMCDRGFGRIIQISSGAGQTGINLGVSLYGASKSGIEGFIRHLSQEVARSGVTANSLALGLMESGGGEATESLARQVPVGRLGAPADVGAAVAYIASEEAAWLTGQTIHLNGGQITT